MQIDLLSLATGAIIGYALSSIVFFTILYGERYDSGFGTGFHEGAKYGRQVNEQKETQRAERKE